MLSSCVFDDFKNIVQHSQHQPNYSESWSTNDTHHWHDCDGCSEKSSYSEHTFISVTIPPTYESQGYTEHICSVCGFTKKDSYVNQLTGNFTVVWENWDGHTLEIDTGVAYKEAPSYDGEQPTKPFNNERHYVFKGWDKQISEITENTVFTAVFEEAEHTFTSVVTEPTYESGGYTTHTCSVCGYSKIDSYTNQLVANFTVTWKNWDGEVLETDTGVGYNEAPSYDGEQPTKPADDEHHYSFKGWDKQISQITESTTFTAQFGAIDHEYTSVVTSPTYESGGYTTHTCSTCGHILIDTYTAPLVGNFTVIWKNWNGDTLEIDTGVGYKAKPSYDGDTPTKQYDEDYHYSFKGWDKQVTEITENTTFTATFEAISHVFEENILSPSLGNVGYTTHTCDCGYSFNDNYKDSFSISLQTPLGEIEVVSSSNYENIMKITNEGWRNDIYDKLYTSLFEFEYDYENSVFRSNSNGVESLESLENRADQAIVSSKNYAATMAEFNETSFNVEWENLLESNGCSNESEFKTKILKQYKKRHRYRLVLNRKL